MVYGDRAYNQHEAITNLNSTSPLNFDTLTAEDLARDLDLFTNTQFFDFDFGPIASTTPPSAFTSSLEQPDQNLSPAASKNGLRKFDEPSSSSSTHPLPALSNDPGVSHPFNFLADPGPFDLANPTPNDQESSPPATKQSDPSPVISPEDAARLAAEEDKRRRNTLASARFRAKKKLREQALEKDHKEMTAKIERLENRIKELELENKWLRGLVVQKKP